MFLSTLISSHGSFPLKSQDCRWPPGAAGTVSGAVQLTGVGHDGSRAGGKHRVADTLFRLRTIQLVLPGLLCIRAVSLFAQVPNISSVVSSADYRPGIPLSSFGTIFGTGLSDGIYQATATPFPTTLGPTTIALCLYGQMTRIQSSDCQPLGLIYVSPTQINFKTPDALAKLPNFVQNVALAVVVSVNGIIDDGASSGTNTGQQLGLALQDPLILFEGYDCFTDARFQDANKDCGLSAVKGTAYRAVRGAVTDINGRIIDSANRVVIGQYYTIWMTGLPSNRPSVSLWLANIPGYQAGGIPFATEEGSPQSFAPSYVGASEAFPGLFQVNFQMPKPVNGDGPPNAFPCGPQDWEFSISIGSFDYVCHSADTSSLPGGSFFPCNQNPDLIEIPVHIYAGDVACGG
jgi:hypothetical protein